VHTLELLLSIPQLRILHPLVMHILQVESMNVSREITKQGKKDVYAQIDSTAGDEEHSERRNEDLLEWLAAIAGNQGARGGRYGDDNDEDCRG
jgi:hypothetical protein